MRKRTVFFSISQNKLFKKMANKNDRGKTRLKISIHTRENNSDKIEQMNKMDKNGHNSTKLDKSEQMLDEKKYGQKRLRYQGYKLQIDNNDKTRNRYIHRSAMIDARA